MQNPNEKVDNLAFNQSKDLISDASSLAAPWELALSLAQETIQFQIESDDTEVEALV